MKGRARGSASPPNPLSANRRGGVALPSCSPSPAFGEGAGGRGPTGGTMRQLTLLAVLAVAGCAGDRAGAPDILPPDVQLTQIGMRNFGLTGGTLDAKVTVRNPNSATIRMSGLLLNLDVQGHRFGSTDYSRPTELAGDSSVTFSVPVDFTWRSVGLAARGVLGTGDVRYAISGRTYVLHLGETWRFPYAKEGNVPLVRIP